MSQRGIGWRTAALLLAGSLLLGGCSRNDTPAAPIPDRPVTVAVTARVTTTDPAAAVDEGSQFYAYNVFQRLMVPQVGLPALKTDLATECRFVDELTYSCIIPKGRSFTNGHALTSQDVKFSIERAQRLAVPGTGAAMLDSLASINANNPQLVEFKLKHPDNNFGFAISTPAASIVDEEAYPADALWPQDQAPISSGPYLPPDRSLDTLVFAKNPRYTGPTFSRRPEVVVKTFSSPALMDRAVATGTVDLVWRGGTPPKDSTINLLPEVLPGADVSRLIWNPKSPRRGDAALRGRVKDSTGNLRTLHSLIPAGIPFAADTFATAAAPAPGPAAELTLAQSSNNDLSRDLLPQVQQALQANGIRVTIAPDPSQADLILDAGGVTTSTPVAWLQAWWEHPLPGQERRTSELIHALRTDPSLEGREKTALTIQQQAAVDATVLPLTQRDRTFYRHPSLVVDKEFKNWMGPGYQLGLWGWTW
ncbi:ABC transporter substrate-binding protein [Enemella dayhoffiae]|uniref:ABC transporter substrate-binding protein n=1 Tax=Enemella dayhoffiae TaxID=2016507 RepID=UPI0015958CAB|nr:ABC transporter substrate-binding protein [Enemella dayhoffiae]